ncbi:ModD protein [Rhodoblastus acidophilus]|uniref:Putative pyrophosphorylase ModD n=1 Tax=Candidatus Rhodoblastus alkanivorans TaxID=2954117 RepID=A0ABS9ZA05_9HYPH|nr:ModD protein [Candidatus Rhodoblastus alkanivorans]MCI4677135.1 ModD protein [Candidatus Rhodoblastus alkanivorans]MCI4684488.1 ModD protein [Candidatus Rhodoblastus alkanivorans]MDI4641809.1 ModD protein [Rhodoblastus acidophilus]
MASSIPRAELERLLFDDAPHGDLTTETLGLADRPGVMRFAAREKMVAALTAEAATILELAGARVELCVADGQSLESGAEILCARGPAGALLRGWKVAQTLIEIWAGVATSARAIVEAAGAVSPGVCVACTRKNIPGVKNFAIAAVKAGGAVMHRLGLSETILVFPEHRAFLQNESLADLVARMRASAPEKKLVIEVRNASEGAAAAQAGFDVIQAEKFSPMQIAELAAATRDLARPPVIAAAGGVKADNARDYVLAGARLLVTSAPYHAPPRDVSVRISAE